MLLVYVTSSPRMLLPEFVLCSKHSSSARTYQPTTSHALGQNPDFSYHRFWSRRTFMDYDTKKVAKAKTNASSIANYYRFEPGVLLKTRERT